MTIENQSVAEIVAGLTKAQRTMLCRHSPTYGCPDSGWFGSATRDATSFAQAGRPLMDMKLIRWTADRRSSQTEITPLGLAVREHLLAQGQPS